MVLPQKKFRYLSQSRKKTILPLVSDKTFEATNLHGKHLVLVVLSLF